MARNNGTAKTQTTTNIKTRKPMQPEQQFKRSFTPLTSKDGTARLTFAGYVHDMAKNTDKPYLRIVFSAMDITRKNPANIAILSSYRYSRNQLIRSLSKSVGMGKTRRCGNRFRR